MRWTAAVVLAASLAGEAREAKADGGTVQTHEVLANKVGQKQQALRKLKAIFHEEPTIKEVQDWALHLYRLEPARINGLASNARLKGLVPEVQASLSNMSGSSYTALRDGLYLGLPLAYDGSTGCQASDPNCGYKELTAVANTQLTWQVNASWGLDKLVFNSEELDARSTVSLEETLVREVTTMYFARRRLMANLMLSPPESEEEAFYEQLRIEEMTANLSAFTDGEFSKHAFHGDLSTGP